MKYKEYSSTRVCAIDYAPLFVEAVKETIQICTKYNVSFTGRSSADVSKFFYHYCLEKFCTGFKNCTSRYPKVLVVHTIPKNVIFDDKKLDKVLKALPVPWCKVNSFQSPDVESACLNALQKYNKDNKTANFANKHSLVKFLNDFKKTKYFSSGTVDLASSQE